MQNPQQIQECESDFLCRILRENPNAARKFVGLPSLFIIKGGGVECSPSKTRVGTKRLILMIEINTLTINWLWRPRTGTGFGLASISPWPSWPRLPSPHAHTSSRHNSSPFSDTFLKTAAVFSQSKVRGIILEFSFVDGWENVRDEHRLYNKKKL